MKSAGQKPPLSASGGSVAPGTAGGSPYFRLFQDVRTEGSLSARKDWWEVKNKHPQGTARRASPAWEIVESKQLDSENSVRAFRLARECCDASSPLLPHPIYEFTVHAGWRICGICPDMAALAPESRSDRAFRTFPGADDHRRDFREFGQRSGTRPRHRRIHPHAGGARSAGSAAHPAGK